MWVDSASTELLEVRSPSTGNLLAKVPHASAKDVNRAVEAARRVGDAWRLTPPFERAAACHRIAERILAHREQIAAIISLEQGKPYFAEALPEVEETAENFRIAAEDVKRLETPIIPARDPNKRLLTFKVAIGTWGIITPWNFPTVIPSEYFGPGIAAGNTIVFKPAEQTPLSGLFLAQCMAEADLPPGVFNLVTGLGPTTGDALVSHPGIDGIGITGETHTGDTIQRRAGVKKLLMELGGNGPQIVLEDADLTRAAKAAAFGAYFNAGQVCAAGSRLYAHSKVFDQVVEGVSQAAARIRLGPGLDPNTEMGPLVSKEQQDRVLGYIDSGRKGGAKIMTGGEAPQGQGYYVKPTVMANVRQDMAVVREEIFGPVLVAQRFDDIDEIAAAANDTPYGLGASIWSKDLSSVQRLVPKIRAGTVWVNCHNMVDPAMPFGGYKQSGFGREHGRAVIELYTELKSVCMAI